MNAQKEARRDAEEFARAQMFYGEGAGTRRKLIQATVDSKIARDPAYGRAFRHELERQDMAEHAQKARKERRRTDASSSVSRNVRAIARGDNKGVNASLLVLGTVVYYAHQTGLDVKIIDASKKRYDKFKQKRANKKVARNVVHNITNLHG
jgi:hypothetical protein